MSELAYELTSTDDERLAQAGETVRDYCGWHIAPPRTETLTFRGDATNRIFLRSLYVTAVESVIVDGATLVEGVDYVVNRAGYITRLGAGAWWSGEEIVVTFTHGYDEPPASVTAVVQALAQGAISNPSALTRKTIGPFTDVYATPSDQLVMGLSAYRIVTVS